MELQRQENWKKILRALSPEPELGSFESNHRVSKNVSMSTFQNVLSIL